MLEVLLVVHLLIALALIAVVLVQRNEGGAGLGGLGGGGGAGAGGMAGFMSGRGQANLLTRITAGLALVFFVTSIILAVLAHQQSQRPSIFDQPLPATTDEQPAEPESAPAESEPEAPSVPLSE
jgi:preprotein translocase subunit SecG